MTGSLELHKVSLPHWKVSVEMQTGADNNVRRASVPMYVVTSSQIRDRIAAMSSTPDKGDQIVSGEN